MSEKIKIPLPTLQELHHSPEEALKNDQFLYLMNQPPIETWLKPHPHAKAKNAAGQLVAARYLPIDKIEFLLDRIFQEWRVEVLREGVMYNSVYVTVRLHYCHPVTGVWTYHDGLGAKALQLDSGSVPSDMTKIKGSAVEMGLPSAKSYAIKDACEHIGKFFGRDINRSASIEWEGAYSKEQAKPSKTEQRMSDLINNCKDRASLSKLSKDVTSNEMRILYDKKWEELK